MNRGRGLGPGSLRKRGDAWTLDFTDHTGQRRRENLGTSKREAEEMRVELIARRNRIVRGLEAAPCDIALSDLRDRYLADLEARVSPAHALNVRQQLSRILSAVPARTVLDLTPVDFVSYRNELRQNGASNRTCNLHQQAVRGMLKWGIEMDIVSQDPLRAIKKLPTGGRHQRYKRRALSEDEIERLLLAVEEDDEVNDVFLNNRRGCTARVPQAPLFLALVETGCRWNELRTAVWSDLDLQQGTLTLRAENTKSARSRGVPLREGLVRRLIELGALYRHELGLPCGDGDAVFRTPDGFWWCQPTNSVNRILYRALKAAGIPRVNERGEKVDLHALRHSCASRLARAGVPLIHTQRILGHSDPRLTSVIYSHIDVEDLRAAVDRLPVLGQPEEGGKVLPMAARGA